MTRSPLLLRRSAAALFATSLLLAACGTSGGSDAAKETTTTADKTTTTTEETTTTTEPTEGDAPTTEDLAALLPTAEEIGDGWVDDTSEPEESPIETATEESCPDAAGVLAPAEEGEPTAAFTNEAGQTLRVTFTEGVSTLDPELLQQTIDAINDCDAVTAQDGAFTITAEFQADENTIYGDSGLQVAVAVNITDGTDSFDVMKYRLRFTDGDVGVTLSAGDGLTDDGTITPIPSDQLDAFAEDIESRVASL